jgi:hypothetical protein
MGSRAWAPLGGQLPLLSSVTYDRGDSAPRAQGGGAWCPVPQRLDPDAAPRGELMHDNEDFRIDYEGPAEGAGYLGNAAADFVLRWSHRSAREISVLVNEPALNVLAGSAGIELNAATRAMLARAAGEAVLRQYASGHGHIEPFIMVSTGTLARQPELAEQVKAALPLAPV